MKMYINFLLLRIFGIKPKNNTLKLEKRVSKTTRYYLESLSFNEWSTSVLTKNR